jgi:hypothetical protein
MARATRYPVQWPLRIRVVGEADWRPGHTLNMSVSGALIITEEPLPVRRPIEFVIHFLTDDGRWGSFVAGSGSIVRSEPSIPGAVAVEFHP